MLNFSILNNVLNEKFKSKLIERKLFFQSTNTIENFVITGIYCGFDATASSLQIGNLLCLSFLRFAQHCKIPIIALLGGATTTVGDPTGKNEARKKLQNQDIANNLSIIEHQIINLIPDIKLVNNATWLNSVTFIDFLEFYSSKFGMGSLLKLKTFATRLKNQDPLSLQEFLYPIMQAIDFLELFENANCNTQCGGADQWCNILTGVDLIAKKHNKNCLGITIPLLTTTDGRKMGKSEKGAIYLAKDKTNPFEFWQFWRNIEDELVYDCLKKFTLLEIERIDSMKNTLHVNEAKILLANEITSWIHGPEIAADCHNNAKRIFIERNTADLPTITMNSKKLVEIIVLTKIVKTNSDAKRLIEQQAIKIDNKIIVRKDHEVTDIEFTLSVGKKHFFKIKIELQ